MSAYEDLTDAEFKMLRDLYGDLVLEDPRFAQSMASWHRRDQAQKANPNDEAAR
jgi:hypothetical protein